MTIIPSILAKSTEELKRICETIAGFSQRGHLDIADGAFVPNATIGLEEVQSADISLELDVHLMVKHPEKVVPLWLGLKNLRSVIFHIEATDPAVVHNGGVNKALQIIDTIHQAGRKAGVSLNPETDVTTLGSVLAKADFIHFMSVHPGFYGAPFQDVVVSKIRHFHELHPGMLLSVDGGIDPLRAKLLGQAGVSECVVGSYILKSNNPKESYEGF